MPVGLANDKNKEAQRPKYEFSILSEMPVGSGTKTTPKKDPTYSTDGSDLFVCMCHDKLEISKN